MNKVALITGITGQDGSYLAEFLLEKNYIVHGIKRRSSSFNTDRIDHIFQEKTEDSTFKLHYGDLSDSLNLVRIINDIKPDEIYNLGAMSHVKVSFEKPEYSSDVDALGTLRILEALRVLDMHKKVKFYQASSSELYGKVMETPQSELTPFYPRSPYGVAKLYSYWITKNYRESYDMFASNGILFNHESPRRGETFVSRKITRAVTRIFHGIQEKIYLGNIYAKRDWGHAKDYIESMWMILQHNSPDDWVISTGLNYSVKDFLIKSFNCLGVDIDFKGKGLNEIAFISKINTENKNLSINQVVMEIDRRYFRPSEVESLLGDSSKARKLLKWEPKNTFDDLVNDMIKNDLILAEKEKILKNLN